jgi:predicted ATPase
VRSDLPTGTVTFLFTDVEGSTKLLHDLGAEAYADALAEHRRVIREACGEHGGVEVDTQGDAFFFAFPTAPRAIAAAERMTATLADGPIQVRIGLHTGTPLLTDEGYIGDDVHFGARVAASGHGGQVVLSLATTELVELELTDLGEHRLKDIPEAVPIFQLGNGSFPPLKTISNTNLPRPASSFVGRDDELLEVLSRVEEGARLVTLTGPGGTGKTRLAIEAAASLVPEFKAGVFWVGLSTLRDPALVTEAIVQTLGAKDGLAEHIGERELLLLLDNLEQVIDAAPELGSLLEACPNLRLLVTSRELLRVRGEVEYAVPPLAGPEAVALFCERSQLERDETIAELCRRLDNLPLAVELAAARTSVLTPQQILERLSQRLDLLKGGRDAEARQQTLRATIEWSYELLSSEEQQLFARLSVFAGGCTLDAAEEVANADLDTLQSLFERSLLRFTEGRYWMLETIREYAGERLVELGEHDAVCDRYLTFLAALSRRAAIEYRESQRESIDRLEEERDNLRAVMVTAPAKADGEQFHELATAYGLLCMFRGPQTEGRSWLDAALKAPAHTAPAVRQRALRVAANLAERQGDLVTGRLLGKESLELARALEDPEAIGAALLTLGIIEADASEFDLAEALQLEALEVFRASGNERELRMTLSMLGFLYMSHARYGQARTVCEEALQRSRAAGDSRGVLAAASNLGHALAHEGRLDEAFQLQREAVILAMEFFDVQGVAGVLLDVAELAVRRYAYEAAATMLGAVAALAASGEFTLVPMERLGFDSTLAEVRSALGAEAADALATHGGDLPVDALVNYAVEFIDSTA